MKRERELKTKLACRSLGKGRKKWTTPQLIVLVRGKPEEGVLVTCKTEQAGGGDFGSPLNIVDSCVTGAWYPCDCLCYTTTVS
ncbi:MAG: hypothetical protein KKG50_00820 [Candidatus Omnitrophica bacterium]|nr:hypothetical protein [Candidatus Omnitrophota bacterium]